MQGRASKLREHLAKPAHLGGADRVAVVSTSRLHDDQFKLGQHKQPMAANRCSHTRCALQQQGGRALRRPYTARLQEGGVE